MIGALSIIGPGRGVDTVVGDTFDDIVVGDTFDDIVVGDTFVDIVVGDTFDEIVVGNTVGNTVVVVVVKAFEVEGGSSLVCAFVVIYFKVVIMLGDSVDVTTAVNVVSSVVRVVEESRVVCNCVVIGCNTTVVDVDWSVIDVGRELPLKLESILSAWISLCSVLSVAVVADVA